MAILLHTGPAKPPSAVRRALAQTPRRLNLVAAALAAAVVAFIAVLISVMSGADDGMSALSAKAAEAKAANDLYLHLTDMDAQAANALLVGFHPTGSVPPAVSAAADLRTYGSERAAADADLQLIGLNPALAAKVRSLLDALGGYESLIGQALYVDQNTDAEKPAVAPPAALGCYEQASAAMHRDVLTAAAQIRDEDDREINAGYTGAHGSAIAYSVGIAILGVVLIALVVGANQYLSRRFRRIIGPALALAALTVAAVTASAAASLGNAAHDYRVAKQAAFDSVTALTNAEAVSYDANADESRWLLDRSGTFQADFFTNAGLIVSPDGVGAAVAALIPDYYYEGVKNAATGLIVNGPLNSVSGVTFGGYLGSELNNVTFDGEADSAYAATNAFDAYIQDDAVIRGDANSGDLAHAVSVDIGLDIGGSNYYFNAYIKSLKQVIDINQTAFTAAVADGRNGLSAWSWLPYFLGVLLLALIAAALYPRLREYR